MKKMLKAGKSLAALILIAGCSVVTPLSDKTAFIYDDKAFETKALAEGYLKKKIESYLSLPVTTEKSQKLVKEIYYASYRHRDLLKGIVADNPEMFDDINADPLVIQKKAESPFLEYINYLNPVVLPPVSCKALKNSGNNTSGTYYIDPDSNTATPDVKVYCDMVTDGGGWTLVVAQYEASAITNWNQGVNGDYLYNSSFALSSSQLPPDRQYTGFSQGTETANDIDYIDFVYTTGDIPSTRRTGYKTGYSYDIYRGGPNYSSHDPEGPFHNVLPNWKQTLTFDRAFLNPAYTWAFSPYASLVDRGYSYNSSPLANSSQNYAWSVWVK